MNIEVSRKAWFSAAITLVLAVLTLLVSTAVAQEPDDGVDLSPAGGSLAGLMTYQGYLEDNGQPANGAYDFRVTVWNAPTGGSQIGGAQVFDITGIAVEDGIFTIYTSPGVPQDVYTGGDRWIQLEVRPHGVGGYTTLPRQPITNVAYAWGLRPGAVISGSTSTLSNFGDAILNIDNTRPSWEGGDSSALYARASTGSAVRGESGGVGVYGYSSATYAIRGEADQGTAGHFTTNQGYGVYASTGGTDHWDHGGYFDANMGYGVYGVSANNYGVRGKGYFGVRGDGTDIGVEGYGSAYTSIGVSGNSSGGIGSGVYGSGYYGVKGNAIGSGHYAGYFYDDVYVGGKLDVVGAVDPIIAERFPADPAQVYESGDVVCLDEASPYVQPCSEGNDTKVIGVVTPGPDIEDGDILVTIMGYQGAQPDEGPDDAEPAQRVVMVVKVDASYGPIQRGDLLTSSPTPGYAMKADPVDIEGVEIYRPGTIIGKAMGSLPEGQGLIEIFVTLQ
jgi:hypothetical protein